MGRTGLGHTGGFAPQHVDDDPRSDTASAFDAPKGQPFAATEACRPGDIRDLTVG